MRTRIRMAARRALAILLSLLMVASPPLQSAALAEGSESGPYISEVYVGVDKTAQKAAEALEAEGWTVLKEGDEPADLNEGASAALKSNRAVVLGYKTTDNASEALTDLAVMNMNGGYSFSDYRTLMDKYRDSQVRPFIERFMATVNEYRANAASDDPGNRARADMARTLLNRIVEDDTGGRMGDLLLEQTKEEMGDAYESLSMDERKKHIDLETALMQGDSSMVLQVERLLSMAADSGDTTWLERLSALGPDGLAEQLGYARPADAEAELASRYQDLATQLADGWDEMRAGLLDHDMRGTVTDEGEEATDEDRQESDDDKQDGDIVVEEEADGEEGAIVVEDDPAAESDEPLVVEGETEASVASAPAPAADVVELGGEDEVDIAELVRLEAPEPAEELETDEIKAEDMPQMLEGINESLAVMAEAAPQIASSQDTSLAAYLCTMPYGDGTLYDLFTMPASEVTGSNIAALYPAASCLSEGQAAAMDFISLEELLQVGATSGDVLAQVWGGDTGLVETAEAAPDVSLYQGVDRRVFGKLTALTSEAMRADALRSQDTGVMDFLSGYRRSALLWTGTAISAVALGASSYMASMERTANQTMAVATETANVVEKDIMDLKSFLNTRADTIKKTVDLDKDYSLYVDVSNVYVKNERMKRIQVGGIKYFGDTAEYEELWNRYAEEIIDWETYQEELETMAHNNFAWSDTITISDDTGFQQQLYEYDDFMDELENFQNPVIQKQSKIWGTVSTVVGAALFVLTVISIISTVIDVVNYYNVDYAPIPGYMVDVSDITSMAEDGTTTVVRNDRAYYKAASTNASREGEDLVALDDYADINGDAGKEWVALYAASRDGQAPILADSLKVVTGTNSMPDGYSTGIHEFGSDSAANLTDARYCYNDDAGGVYAYFRRDEGVATAAASAFGSGTAALWAGAGLAVGAAGGAGVTAFAGKRRRDAFA